MTQTLTINLDAIASNWRTYNELSASRVDCGAVVKADAYGLGVAKVVPALYTQGCRSFYVANLDEALRVKNILDALQTTAMHDWRLYVLSGCAPGEEPLFIANKIIPVLVSLTMVQRWVAAVVTAGVGPVSSVLKINTGMGRLGLEPDEFECVIGDSESVRHAGINMLMSHLACADDPGHMLNGEQLQRFNHALLQARKAGFGVTASLANSAGISLGSEFHFDAVRPGIGLYGGYMPYESTSFALQPVVSLHLPVVQIRDLPAGESVGYGATRYFNQDARLAVVAGGYADGLFRALSNRGSSWVADPNGSGGWLAPIVGRISMDTTIVDISAVPRGIVQEGSRLEFIGPHLPLENIAKAAGTITYEVLTSLGARYNRQYINEARL